MGYQVSKDEFGELVEEALRELPPEFAQFIEEIPIEIHDSPSKQQLESLKIKRGGTLLGLYSGRPRTVRSVEHSGVLPDRIYLFQGPIQSIVGSREELVLQIRKTLLHEIGHHFGMSEDDLERLGYQ
jgi:predicted Zn-dependent protease with MMP-like domain